MKIGLISGEYPPMQGGVGAFTQELARALAALPDAPKLHIITRRQARPSADPARRNWRQLREPVDLGFAQLHPHVHRWRWPILSQITDWAIRYELDAVNIQYQAAAFDMRSPAVNLLPWRLRPLLPTFVTFHDLRVPYLFPKAGGLRRWLINWMARQASGVIVTNQPDEEDLRRAGLPAGKIAQIPIGSNIPVYPASAAAVAEQRAQWGLSDGHFLLGYFGFLNESKGAELLIQTLARLDTAVHLVFIGGRTGSSDAANNARYLAQLDAQIAALGLVERVHWTEFLPDEQTSVCLQAADLMVMPYRDGVSLRRGTLMAALAHGRPLISTEPVTPVSALVHGRHIWLIPVDDVDGLATAVQTLQADPALRQRLGAAAAKLGQQFSWDSIAAQTFEFLKEKLPRFPNRG
jgi:glycosyltransferase involved in cell wall biosynthesis